MSSRSYESTYKGAYRTDEERARNARYLREAEEDNRRRAEETDKLRRRLGLDEFTSAGKASITGSGLYGSEKQVDVSRDVNYWMRTTETTSQNYEGLNRKTVHFTDNSTTPKADPTKSGGLGRQELYAAQTHGRGCDDDHYTRTGEEARRRDTSPSKTVGRQEPKSVGYTDDDYTYSNARQTASYDRYDTYDHNRYSDQRFQQQETMQQQRSIQASMQMAYTVFGNVITALETYEEREARKYGYRAPRKSRIPIPDQGFKNNEDVKASLMSQLKVFETHLKVCPKQVRDDVTSDMKVMVAEWLSARDDPRRFPPTKTDEYAARLFEILVKGSTVHADFSRHQKVMGKTELMGNFQKVVRGQALADDLDRSFRDDPRKTATRPDVRRGTDINKGLRRIDVCNASLSPYTRELKEPSTSIR